MMIAIIAVKIPKGAMKLSAQKVADNREKVIDAALRLFRERGFDGVSVADLMRDAGLTHGGFYNHFESKTALEAEVCRRAFNHSVDGIRAMEAPVGRADHEAGLRGYVSRYLSRTRRDTEGATCPMVAFAGDVTREPDAVGQAYSEGVRAYIGNLAAKDYGPEARERAIVMASTLIGALTLARSVRKDDPALSDEILDSVRQSLLKNLPEKTPAVPE